ncbi:Integrase core domain protein [Roseovarius albus]|uniref:Integrase core domain protein n=1 Tax=Roseovarius albus TaxID=1247867 RepID=A0A1X6ZPV8_9RHOB|nr:IS3 family transposase [Roseovarius albus]SLN58078.1 Integrase core domain protein [Roseovarius albus]
MTKKKPLTAINFLPLCLVRKWRIKYREVFGWEGSPELASLQRKFPVIRENTGNSFRLLRYPRWRLRVRQRKREFSNDFPKLLNWEISWKEQDKLLTHPNHIWAIDFVHDKLSNGRSYKMLTVLDEYTREALCVAVRPKMNANDVLDALHPLLMKHGQPEFIRSDNGPEFIAQAVRDWIAAVGAKTAYIEPGSPWENGYCESFNARFRDELLNGEVFYTLREAQVVIEKWRKHYNTKRPHSALGYRPPAPVSVTRVFGTNVGLN